MDMSRHVPAVDHLGTVATYLSCGRHSLSFPAIAINSALQRFDSLSYDIRKIILFLGKKTRTRKTFQTFTFYGVIIYHSKIHVHTNDIIWKDEKRKWTRLRIVDDSMEHQNYFPTRARVSTILIRLNLSGISIKPRNGSLTITSL